MNESHIEDCRIVYQTHLVRCSECFTAMNHEQLCETGSKLCDNYQQVIREASDETPER